MERRRDAPLPLRLRPGCELTFARLAADGLSSRCWSRISVSQLSLSGSASLSLLESLRVRTEGSASWVESRFVAGEAGLARSAVVFAVEVDVELAGRELDKAAVGVGG